MKKKFLYAIVLILFMAGVAYAQPVDLERTLPDLIGKTNEEIEGILGRPDSVFNTGMRMHYTYDRWRTRSLTLFFVPYRGQWVLDDYSMFRTSGHRRYYRP